MIRCNDIRKEWDGYYVDCVAIDEPEGVNAFLCNTPESLDRIQYIGRWLDSNVTGKYAMFNRFVAFQLLDDAVLFRMTFA